MLILFPALSLAAPPAEPDTVEVIEEGKRFRYKKRQEIEFEGVRVDGRTDGPDVILLPEQPRPVFPSFVVLRENWDTEQRWSIDEIQ